MRVLPTAHLALLLLFAPLSTAATPAADPPALCPPHNGPPVERLLARELARLDQELDLATFPDGSGRWLARLAAVLEHRLPEEETGTVAAPHLMRHLAMQLRELGVELDLVAPGRPSMGRPCTGTSSEATSAEREHRLRALLETVRLLRGKIHRLNRSAVRRHRVQARTAPANDSCLSATIVENGTVTGSTAQATNDGSASCALSFPTPDVWFDYTADHDGPVSFDTLGSAFDTVLTLFDACPGSGQETELACNDDAEGTTQSRLILPMTAGQTVRVRVSGFGDAVGTFDLTIASAYGVTGTVTRAANGDPLAGVEVELHDAGILASTTTGADGAYSIDAPSAGTYAVRTRNAPGMFDEIYDDVPCYGWNNCWWHRTPVEVSGPSIGGIDFALSPAGAISGTVTDRATSSPLSSAYVHLYSSTGSHLTSARTDAAGSYEIGGLPTGSYHVRAGTSDHADEVYDDVPCQPTCPATTGTQIQVVEGATSPGIDFALDRLGAISGTVTDAVTGEAAEAVMIVVFEQRGVSLASAFTRADGTYQVAGLPAGTYYVGTDSAVYGDEMYDDVPCVEFCDVTSGAAVTVSPDSTTPGIDFSLLPLGRISGTVRHAVTGLPLDLALELLSENGAHVSSGRADVDGRYLFEGLEPGDYFVRTDAVFVYANELYDDQPCQTFCTIDTGTSVPVSLNTTTTGIDFAIDELGAISGTVTDAVSGAGLPAEVIAFDSSGNEAATAFADGDGSYRISSLSAGTYHVLTNLSTHQNEFYDDLLASEVGGATNSVPIPVSLNTTTSGIDFVLDRMGEITGTVTDATSGLPVQSARIDIYNDRGKLLVPGDSSGTDGGYLIRGLPSGTYYLKTDTVTHQDEIYDDVACPSSCNATDGTPVQVEVGNRVSDVDFDLVALGAITGAVVDEASGTAIPSLSMELYSPSGVVQRLTSTVLDGTFAFQNVAAGQYYVRATSSTHIGELYDDVACPRTCTQDGATPITVSLDTTTSGIDFSLLRAATIEGEIRAADTGAALTGDVHLYDTSLTFIESTHSSSLVGFRFRTLPPGSYYVKSHRTPEDGYQDELFADVPCEPTCDFSAGTPIQVLAGSRNIGVDLELLPCPADSYGEVTGTSYFSSHEETACLRLTAHTDTTVQPGADVTFKAGRTVVLGDGFSVQTGGSFRAVIESAWAKE